LEHTLLHCQTESDLLQATRDNYLSIIDEFKRDLEELTEQVEQQQQQLQQSSLASQSCPEPELHFVDQSRINCELEIQVGSTKAHIYQIALNRFSDFSPTFFPTRTDNFPAKSRDCRKI